MAFDATKKEWSELYSFFRLIADGYVACGTIDKKADEENILPVAMITREEHDGTRRYILSGDDVHIVGENIDMTVPRARFSEIAAKVLDAVRAAETNDVVSPDGVEEFLDEIKLFDLEAKTEDRTDYYVSFYSDKIPPVGVSVRSCYGVCLPLLDGGRTANLKYELLGAKFSGPTVNKVNAVEGQSEVLERILMIERLGASLKYRDVADKVFRANVAMFDLQFHRILGEMLRIMQTEGITKVDELVEQVKIVNPLKIKDEQIHKHHFYEYKMKQFLVALACGMRPAKIFNGLDSAIEALMFVCEDGHLLCYRKADKRLFETFLYRNAVLMHGSVQKDKYGFIEKENGVLYFKLNLKIGLL